MDLAKSIYIENFPLNTTESILKEVFIGFGKIEKIDLPIFGPEHPLTKKLKREQTQGYAFIEFTDKQSVKKACDHFNSISNILQNDTEILDDTEDEKFKISGKYNMALIRVMPKQLYVTLAKRYDEQRFLSMVNAAKLLVVAS